MSLRYVRVLAPSKDGPQIRAALQEHGIDLLSVGTNGADISFFDFLREATRPVHRLEPARLVSSGCEPTTASGGRAMRLRLSEIELHGSDMEASRRFYGERLGLETSPVSGTGWCRGSGRLPWGKPPMP